MRSNTALWPSRASYRIWPRTRSARPKRGGLPGSLEAEHELLSTKLVRGRWHHRFEAFVGYAVLWRSVKSACYLQAGQHSSCRSRAWAPSCHSLVERLRLGVISLQLLFLRNFWGLIFVLSLIIWLTTTLSFLWSLLERKEAKTLDNPHSYQ